MKRLLGFLALATLAAAQVRTIGTGTNIPVRTNETIDTNRADGWVFTGVVDQEVMDASNYVAMPRGSNVELRLTTASSRELTLDLDSVTVHGQRYAVTSDASLLSGEQKDGLWTNKRTAGYVGGGSALSAIS